MFGGIFSVVSTQNGYLINTGSGRSKAYFSVVGRVMIWV